MKRIASALVVLLALAACSGTEGTLGGPSSALDAPAPAAPGPRSEARAAIERDLVLTLRRASSDPFEVGRDPAFEVVLSNKSTTKSYPIVLSSDGSEAGWREPHVFFTVEKRASASEPFRLAPEQKLARCGMYDQDWTKDVQELAPGKEVVLPWFHFHDFQFDLEDAAQVRVTANYAYGDHARDLSKVPPILHSTPAYALRSNAMELAVDAPLVIELAYKGVLPKSGEPLSKSFAATVVNRGRAAVPFAAADTGGNFQIELEGEEESDGSKSTRSISSGFSVDHAKDRILPGARRDAIGAGKAMEDTFLKGFRPKRARATLHVWWYVDETQAKSDERYARSGWITLGK